MGKHLLAVAACIVLMAGSAVAVDMQPPPWRGEESTTSQIWEFSSDQGAGVAIKPDGPAPGGKPPLDSTQLVVYPVGDWMEEYEPCEYETGKWVGYGVWPLSGTIGVIVDNHEPPNEVKYVWVQLTWAPMISGAEPSIYDFDPAPHGDVEVVSVSLGSVWNETTYKWEIRPNPVDEAFTIGGSIYVDQLVIDTWCIPEPTIVALVSIGAMALLRRRR